MSIVNCTNTLTMNSFEFLSFTDTGKERFNEVLQFLDELEGEAHPLFQKIYEELLTRLSRLNSYGGVIDEEDLRRRFRVTLGRDFAPLSFTLVWSRLDIEGGEHRFAFNGGLIWHGGSNEPFSVSLTPQFWGIHT